MTEEIVVWTVALALVLLGALLLCLPKSRCRLNRFGPQIIGLAFILPVVLVLASIDSLDSEAVAGVLGTMVGYLFGMTQPKQYEWLATTKPCETTIWDYTVNILSYGINEMSSMQPQTQPDPQRVASAALQAFFNLSQRWELTAAQERILLGDPPTSTFFRWKASKHAARLGRDTLDRVSYLLGIHKALNILLPSAAAADQWVKKPNEAPLFGGHSALERMLGGSVADLADVRRYLDAQRG